MSSPCIPVETQKKAGTITRLCPFIGLVLVLLSAMACACAAEEATPTPAISEPTPTAVPATTPTKAPTATTSEQTITITGVVMDVSLSARIIMLTETVQGFDTVALTEETEILSNGGKATLQDIQQGMTIEASGKPGASGAILADEVLIIPPKPT